jgi:putative acetyltransferase
MSSLRASPTIAKLDFRFNAKHLWERSMSSNQALELTGKKLALFPSQLTASVRPRGGDLMQIRRAEAADEKALTSIRRSAILALAVPAMSMEQAEKWATRAAADRMARAIRDHGVWVAVEGATIGWVDVDRDRIAALYVSPSCARPGVGSALLALAETSIRNSGYATVRLESSQNALDFYLRRGYLRCGPPDVDGALPLRKELATVGPYTPLRQTGSAGG